MKKIPLFLLFALSAFLTTTSFALTPSEQKAEIKTLTKELKSLPQNSPAATVIDLAKKLTALDPKKAASYYKLALNKLVATDANKTAAQELANALTTLLQNIPDLSASQVAKLTKQIEASKAKFVAGTYNPATDGSGTDETENQTDANKANSNEKTETIDTTLTKDPSPSSP